MSSFKKLVAAAKKAAAQSRSEFLPAQAAKNVVVIRSRFDENGNPIAKIPATPPVKKIVEVQSRRATIHHISESGEVVIAHPKSKLIGTTNFKKDCTLSRYGKTVGTPTASNWNITVLTEDGIVKVL